jgi:hypothetical protein
MQTNKCHFCNAPIYPGEKRCGITIRIFPDQEEDFFLEEPCPENGLCMEECLLGICGLEEEDVGDVEVEEEFFQEAHMVLCKDCQDQFLSNPSIKESLFFLRREPSHKTVH